MKASRKGLSARAWFYGTSGFGHSGANVPQRTAPEAPGNRVDATIDGLVEMVCCAEQNSQSSEEQSTGDARNKSATPESPNSAAPESSDAHCDGLGLSDTAVRAGSSEQVSCGGNPLSIPARRLPDNSMYTAPAGIQSSPSGQESDTVTLLPSSEIKQPWQMTRLEWEAERDAVRPSWHSLEKAKDGPRGKAQGNKLHAQEARLIFLLGGASGRESIDGEVYDAPITHRMVVKLAIEQGKPVPPEVAAEYFAEPKTFCFAGLPDEEIETLLTDGRIDQERWQ